MKTRTLPLSLLVLVFIFWQSPLVLSQARDAVSADRQSPPSPERVVELMGERLSLTGEQKDALLPLIRVRQAKLLAVRNDSSLGLLEKARKSKAILKESDEGINAILTPAQRKLYAQMEAEAMSRAMHGMGPS